MIKFVVKSLFAIAVTSSALLLTISVSNAQVNMKVLTEVVKSCQKDALSNEYYQQLDLQVDISQEDDTTKNYLMQNCIQKRYHYLLVLNKFPWLKSTEDMLPQYPGSVAVATLLYNTGWRNLNVLDCLASRNSSSEECNKNYPFYIIAPGARFDSLTIRGKTELFHMYQPYICPSCVITHDNIVERDKIINAFIQWFLKLDISQRRELISIIEDKNSTLELRKKIDYETERAVEKYLEAKQRVQQEELERRRQELLSQ